MNRYLKEFLKRGMAFGGFGPIIAGIVYLILSFCIDGFTLGGVDVFVAIVSTYLLAFVQAGASVFNQIEGWSVAKSLLCHLGSIYLAYVGCYLINSWIPFEPMVVAIFTAVFVVTYFIIWVAVYLSIKAVSKRLNSRIE